MNADTQAAVEAATALVADAANAECNERLVDRHVCITPKLARALAELYAICAQSIDRSSHDTPIRDGYPHALRDVIRRVTDLLTPFSGAA